MLKDAGRFIRKTDPGNQMSKYELMSDARSAYFEPGFSEIGSAAEIDDVTRRVFHGYLQGDVCRGGLAKGDKGARQGRPGGVRLRGRRPHKREIESASEVQNHPEHVMYNMTSG
ncbi:MAG: hypothetical protein J4F28_05725 [Nitrosopumilaceae archaeon]|nr:hypothetical protein [Nitrosopumilaceae archaeon]